MIDPHEIVPEMEVYAADGVHIGTVDALEGERIRLNTVAVSVPVAAGHDHFVSLGEVTHVEGNRIHVRGTGAAYCGRGAQDPDATLNR